MRKSYIVQIKLQVRFASFEFAIQKQRAHEQNCRTKLRTDCMETSEGTTTRDLAEVYVMMKRDQIEGGVALTMC